IVNSSLQSTDTGFEGDAYSNGADTYVDTAFTNDTIKVGGDGEYGIDIDVENTNGNAKFLSFLDSTKVLSQDGYGVYADVYGDGDAPNILEGAPGGVNSDIEAWDEALYVDVYDENLATKHELVHAGGTWVNTHFFSYDSYPVEVYADDDFSDGGALADQVFRN